MPIIRNIIISHFWTAGFIYYKSNGFLLLFGIINPRVNKNLIHRNKVNHIIPFINIFMSLLLGLVSNLYKLIFQILILMVFRRHCERLSSLYLLPEQPLIIIYKTHIINLFKYPLNGIFSGISFFRDTIPYTPYETYFLILF